MANPLANWKYKKKQMLLDDNYIVLSGEPKWDEKRKLWVLQHATKVDPASFIGKIFICNKKLYMCEDAKYVCDKPDNILIYMEEDDDLFIFLLKAKQ